MFERKLERLTRKSYRRKLIMFGASIFMSLALVATGFAAWVLSKDAQVQGEGEVQVGAVKESSIEISAITFADNIKNFVFEPQEGDAAGRVRNDGSNFENMDITISWQVSNYQIVGELFVDFKIPETVHNAIEAGFISVPAEFVKKDGVDTTQVADKNYYVYTYNIGADKTAGNDVAVDDYFTYTLTETGGVETMQCELTLKFNWGEKFGNDNPGIYYDTDFPEAPSKGTGVEFDEVKSTLNKFKATLHGIEYNETFEDLSEDDKKTLYDESPVAKYFIVINANVA